MGQWKEAYEKLTSQYEEIQVIVFAFLKATSLVYRPSMHAVSCAIVGHETGFQNFPAARIFQADIEGI